MLHSNRKWHTTILFWHPALRKRRVVTQAGMYMMYSSSRSDRHRDAVTQWTQQPERRSVWQDEQEAPSSTNVFSKTSWMKVVWPVPMQVMHYFTLYGCAIHAITKKQNKKSYSPKVSKENCILRISHLRLSEGLSLCQTGRIIKNQQTEVSTRNRHL